MSRILIAFASSYGHTQRVAAALAADLRRTGHTIELADAMVAFPPPVEDYDAVVLASRVQFGVHARQIAEYIAANREALTSVPSYFVSVSMSAAHGGADPNGYLARLFATTRWQPREAVAIGGGLPYRDYGPITRFVMKQITRRGGGPTDTRQNHDCTDWSQVHAFASRIAGDLVTVRAPFAAPRAQA